MLRGHAVSVKEDRPAWPGAGAFAKWGLHNVADGRYSGSKDPTVDEQTAMPTPPGRRRAALNTLGVVVLLLGITCAGLVYWSGQNRSAARSKASADGDWRDQSLSTEDSKASTRDVEEYYGQLGMFALRLEDWFANLGRPGPLAGLIATVAALAALGCFTAAHRSGDR